MRNDLFVMEGSKHILRQAISEVMEQTSSQAKLRFLNHIVYITVKNIQQESGAKRWDRMKNQTTRILGYTAYVCVSPSVMSVFPVDGGLMGPNLKCEEGIQHDEGVNTNIPSLSKRCQGKQSWSQVQLTNQSTEQLLVLSVSQAETVRGQMET